jgi:hypothetical protein
MKINIAFLLFAITVASPRSTWAQAATLESDSLKIARASLQTKEAKEASGREGGVIRLDPGELEGAQLEPLRIYVGEHAYIWRDGKWAEISWDKLEQEAQTYREASRAIAAEPYVAVEIDAATESQSFQTAMARLAAPINGKALGRIFVRRHQESQKPAKPARLPLPPPLPSRK